MKLPILQYGDPMLRAKGKGIDQIDDRIRELAANMLETMEAANGVGLAAQQVGEALQLTVLDISRVEDRPSTMKLNGQDVDPQTAMPLVLINPEIEFGDVVYGPLHDIVGGGLARELCFTGRVVEAREAKALGLVSSVVPVDELASEVARFTALIGRAPRDVLLRTKAKAIRRAAVVRDKTLDL